jgi:4-amino-4-deoxychorismate lyase
VHLIETICFEEGRFHRLNFHNERLNRSRKELFGSADELKIKEFLHVPAEWYGKKIKCRILYSHKIEEINCQEYKIKQVQSLRMVNGDHIIYNYKYADRTSLNALLHLKGMVDEILIVRDGFITDTSYSNIVFRKNGSWFTPVNPLLKGTRREYYLSTEKIKTALIRPHDLKEFSEARLINAMISLEESGVIPIKNITW